jgi:hypothetical protein
VKAGVVPDLFDAVRVHDQAASGEGWLYVEAPDDVVTQARYVVLDGKHVEFSKITDLEPVRYLAAWCASLGLGVPESGILHWNKELKAHHDRLSPHDCTNVTLFLRSSCNGGELLLETTTGVQGFTCRDGMALVFDGQLLHGVTDVKPVRMGGYRASVTLYCPTP